MGEIEQLKKILGAPEKMDGINVYPVKIGQLNQIYGLIKDIIDDISEAYKSGSVSLEMIAKNSKIFIDVCEIVTDKSRDEIAELDCGDAAKLAYLIILSNWDIFVKKILPLLEKAGAMMMTEMDASNQEIGPSESPNSLKTGTEA